VIKSELIQIIASRNAHLLSRDVEKIVDAIFDEITGVLGEGGRAELRGFGAFTVKHRPAHSARNPGSGETIDVEEKWAPFFKPGKKLREQLKERA
jgi:integration host factor subunit beta